MHSSGSNGTIALRSCLLMMALCWAANALAACNAFSPSPELYVGDTDSGSPTYDSACTQNTIAAAIQAATCIYGTKIFITHPQTYTGQSLMISDKNVTLIGRANGVACGPISIGICDPDIGCPQPPTSPLLTISGTNGQPVIAISGTSHVTLQYLDINNGNNGGGNGGGIDFEGTGSLTVDTSWIRANQANLGAGIYFAGASGATVNELKLLSNTQILANTAGASGGGIYVGGNALLTITQPQILIEGNHADNGYGGGVAVFGPATAHIGSPGLDGTGVLNQNSAAYGGGIAVKGGDADEDDAQAVLFTTDASQPIGITNNTASHTGGGIYAKPHTQAVPSVFAYADVNAWDYRIDGNHAANGAAIYADVDPSINQSLAGEIWLGDTLEANGGFPSDLGAVRCTNAAACNSISDNYMTTVGQGAIILIQDTGYLVANGFSMRGNQADNAINIVGDNVRVDLYNCLLAENTVQHELIYESGSNAPTIIDSCTFANDTINTTHVIHAESGLTLDASIIDEPGTLALDYSGDSNALVVSYVLSNDITTLPADSTGLLFGEPTFADPAAGDYHLKQTSLGVDFAPTSSSYYVQNSLDRDRKPRNFDLPTAPNIFGTQDLGAYELQNLFRHCGTQDTVFCDGFEP